MPAASAVYDNVFKEDRLGFFPGGSVDAKRVADFLELTREDVSKIAQVRKASVRWDEQIPKPMLERLAQIANICNLVAEHFNSDKAKVALWFKAPNPMFGNIAPRDMIRYGQYKKLLKFVLQAREEGEPHDETAREE